MEGSVSEKEAVRLMEGMEERVGAGECGVGVGARGGAGRTRVQRGRRREAEMWRRESAAGFTVVKAPWGVCSRPRLRAATAGAEVEVESVRGREEGVHDDGRLV